MLVWGPCLPAWNGQHPCVPLSRLCTVVYLSVTLWNLWFSGNGGRARVRDMYVRYVRLLPAYGSRTGSRTGPPQPAGRSYRKSAIRALSHYLSQIDRPQSPRSPLQRSKKIVVRPIASMLLLPICLLPCNHVSEPARTLKSVQYKYMCRMHLVLGQYV